MSNKALLVILILASLLQQSYTESTEIDVNTFSNYDEVEIVHFDFDLNVDFDTKTVSGDVTLEMFSLISNLEKVILDIWDLSIDKVYFGSITHGIEKTEVDDWMRKYCTKACPQGGYLEINVSNLWTGGTYIPAHNSFELYISYNTTPQEITERFGYNFVDAAHTKGGKKPIFYTQNEPIYMRSWIPFQDTPMVQADWTASIIAPSDLKVYMSGIQQSVTDNKDGTSTTSFKSEDHQTAGYYIGIVIGDLQKKKISNRVYLIAESENISDGEALLKYTEQMIQATEAYMGKTYFWNSFSVVVMPDNYPFEGAAHPGLSFVSPSVLSQGDYGQDVVLHLVACSYFGNELTHANWSNVWISQGFATFLRRKVQLDIFGTTYPEMDRIDSNFTMYQEMKDFDDGIEDTFATLHPDTNGVSPDDSLSLVPYEKGYQFLLYIENILGSNNMKSLLQAYIKEEELKGIDYEHFQSYLEDYVASKLQSLSDAVSKIDWEKWIFGGGLPSKTDVPDFTSEEFDEVYNLSNKFIQFSGTSLPSNYAVVNDWHQIQKYGFIDVLIDNEYQMDRRLCYQIDNIYDFKTEYDSELSSRWFELATVLRYTHNDDEEYLMEFVSSTGRIKYLAPIFENLMLTGRSSFAKSLLAENEDWYHSYTVSVLNQIVYGTSYGNQQSQTEAFE